MTKKTLKTETADITFEIDLDDFTWGDLEDMESASPTKVRQVFQKFARVEGVEDMVAFLRGLSINQFNEISTQFQKAVTAAQNPVSKNGKN